MAARTSYENALLNKQNNYFVTVTTLPVSFHTGNIALKHKTRDVKVNSIRQGSVTTDGIFYEGDCLSDNRKAHWDVRFGGIVRVAAVFVLHSKHSYSTAKGIVIRVVHGKLLLFCSSNSEQYVQQCMHARKQFSLQL